MSADSWIGRLSDAELTEAIESTGHMAASLYAQGSDTEQVDGKLDELMAEFDRRAPRSSCRRTSASEVAEFFRSGR